MIVKGGGIMGFAIACSNTSGLVTRAIPLGFGLSEIPKDLSNVIVVAQATSKQASKHDPLIPYMNITNKMLADMLTKDPSFKHQGGRLGENDMDYDNDEKSMVTRQLRIARGYDSSEYMNFVTEALEIEDTIKNYELCDATG
ncbi:hypothetical protein Tco_1302144 [Tanacetum coccineum]